MKRIRFWQVLLAIGFLMGTFVGCPQTTPRDAVTRVNSPQYAKDYDNIDSFYVVVDADCKIDATQDINYYEKSWCLELSPREAKAAHALLRDLLHDYPLSRSFRGTQTKFLTAENIAISFYQITGDTEENVFDMQIFSAGPYMEIHHRLGVEGTGVNAVVTGRAGTEVSLEGPVKAKLASFLADCIAKANEKESQALKDD